MKEINKDLSDRHDRLFAALVPGYGKADTAEGEMIRAIAKIIYRFYNDGDVLDEGYGIETVGPAHSYLIRSSPLASQLRNVFRQWLDEDGYVDMLNDVLKTIVEYVEGKQGKYEVNNIDMLDSTPVYQSKSNKGYFDDDDLHCAI